MKGLMKKEEKMKGKNLNKEQERQVMVDGMMTFGKLDDNRHTADFQTYEDAQVVPFTGRCKVQAMRGGNVYITEYPRRVRNRPLFRQDNSSLSLGRNGIYYFVFRLPEGEVGDLPSKLVREANEAAAKMSGHFYKK